MKYLNEMKVIILKWGARVAGGGHKNIWCDGGGRKIFDDQIRGVMKLLPW